MQSRFWFWTLLVNVVCRENVVHFIATAGYELLFVYRVEIRYTGTNDLECMYGISFYMFVRFCVR